ncbi:hypothetical protein G5716_25030 [Bacillus pacificus]|nr:hypothetical protein [Bacillus pacificus]
MPHETNVSESRAATLYTISNSTTTTDGTKKKGFLAKLFKKHDPTEPYMQIVPPYRQMEGPPMMHQQPPPQYRQQYQQQYQHQYPQQYQQQYQPYMQQHPEQMIPPQMYESNDTRGGAATTATSSSGIGSFFRI